MTMRVSGNLIYLGKIFVLCFILECGNGVVPEHLIIKPLVLKPCIVSEDIVRDKVVFKILFVNLGACKLFKKVDIP